MINGKRVDLQEKGNEIKYNMMIADIFDIAKVSASYTSSFTLPKTPDNTAIFEFLGIVGDNSTIPYKRVPIVLKNYGFDVIPRGWLQFKETSDNYKVSIESGMTDFFKEIENKTLGVDLDLKSFDHLKRLDVVVSTFSESNDKPFKYIIADYGGLNISVGRDSEGFPVNGRNIDYLVPCFSVKALFDIIFSTFNFTYNINEIDFIKDLFITYPMPPQDKGTDTHISQFNRNYFSSRSYLQKFGGLVPVECLLWTQKDMSAGYIKDGYLFGIPEQGVYRAIADTEAYTKHTIFNNTYGNVYFVITKNDQIIKSAIVDMDNKGEIDTVFNANKDDLIGCFLVNRNGNVWETVTNNINFGVFKTEINDVSLTKAFKDFKITDFFKEILCRTGLTPVSNPLENKISFVKLKDRLDFSKSIDWTDKFISRKKESYVLGDYGIRNAFNLKHDENGDRTGDGFLYTNNMNLKDETVLFESKMYAPEFGNSRLTAVWDQVSPTNYEVDVPTFKVWSKEAKKNNDNQIVIDYKGLNNRFYFVRYEMSEAHTFAFVSETFDEGLYLTNKAVPIAITDNTLFEETIYLNYSEFSELLKNFKLLEIDLALTLPDILSLDMTKCVFFKQESSYFMLNKLIWQEGKPCTGEFIRINKI